MVHGAPHHRRGCRRQLLTGDPFAIHRYAGSMVTRLQALAKIVVEQYDGGASNIWTGVDSGAEQAKKRAMKAAESKAGA